MIVPFTKLQLDSCLSSRINEKILDVIQTAQFVMGDELLSFENKLAKFYNMRHAFGVGNGTDAIEIALRATGISAGDRVIVPVNTFAATAMAVVRLGAIPVFVDCDIDTYNLDLKLIKHIIDTDNIKAIIPVHLYGQMVNMQLLRSISGSDMIIIEDAAQSHGASYNDDCSGVYSDAVATSFYPTKNLGCYGDGGAILTNNCHIATNISNIRNYGSIVKYHHDSIGFNSRLDEIQAAILSIKLEHLSAWNKLRYDAAQIYNAELSSLVRLPKIIQNTIPAYHLYIIMTRDLSERNECISFLNSNGIDAKIHYPTPLHLQPAFSYLGYSNGSFPIAEYISERIISLPMFSDISNEQQEYVINAISRFYEQK